MAKNELIFHKPPCWYLQEVQLKAGNSNFSKLCLHLSWFNIKGFVILTDKCSIFFPCQNGADKIEKILEIFKHLFQNGDTFYQEKKWLELITGKRCTYIWMWSSNKQSWMTSNISIESYYINRNFWLSPALSLISLLSKMTKAGKIYF